MGVTTEKYVRKPLYVDAVRVTSKNFDEIVAWTNGTVEVDDGKPGAPRKYIWISKVSNPKGARQMKAFLGDWILTSQIEDKISTKIYTNKAFRESFDLVEIEEEHIITPPTSIEEVSVVPEEPNPQTGVQPILEVHESPEMAQARQTIESEGGTIEEATPEAIAEVVNEQQPRVEVDEGVQVADSPTAPPVPDGKRVLTEAEQQHMTPTEVRELVQSGEVILEQDLAA